MKARRAFGLRSDFKAVDIVVLCLIGLSVACAIAINISRLAIEKDDRVTGIFLDYDEFAQMVSSAGSPAEELAGRLREAGVTGLMVREQVLSDLEKSGDVFVLDAADLSFQQEVNPGFYSEIIPEKNRTYLFIGKESAADRIHRNLAVKTGSEVTVEKADGQALVLSAALSSREIAAMGFGFPVETMKAAADAGLRMAVRLRSFAPVNDVTLTVMRKNLEEVPSLVLVGFNDENLPGLLESKELQAIGDVIQAAGNVPLAAFEFYAQGGLETLANVLRKNLIRVHSINENEMRRYDFDSAADRYVLAATERNMRALYVRLFGMEQPAGAWEYNRDFIRQLRDSLIEEGLEIGAPASMRTLNLDLRQQAVLGLGVVAGGIWLLTLVWRKPGLWPAVLGLLGGVCWIGGLIFAPHIARKGFAFLSVVIFPVLGLTLFLRKKPRGLPQSVGALLGISGVSMTGALIMTGLLGEKSFMLALDGFKGVKLAHVLPLVLAPAVLWVRQPDPVGRARRILLHPVLVWQAAAAALILAALAVYVLRTGNTGPLQVSSLEELFRQTLDHWLGVRPRTKEFLAGYPWLLLLLYFGYDDRKIPILLFAVIGQVSLANTYAHIHTPLTVSFLRSFNGLWMGILFGAAVVGLVTLWLRVYARYRNYLEDGL
jgi:hypothetical protein